jgi:hypothetical protein
MRVQTFRCFGPLTICQSRSWTSEAQSILQYVCGLSSVRVIQSPFEVALYEVDTGDSFLATPRLGIIFVSLKSYSDAHLLNRNLHMPCSCYSITLSECMIHSMRSDIVQERWLEAEDILLGGISRSQDRISELIDLSSALAELFVLQRRWGDALKLSDTLDRIDPYRLPYDSCEKWYSTARLLMLSTIAQVCPKVEPCPHVSQFICTCGRICKRQILFYTTAKYVFLLLAQTCDCSGYCGVWFSNRQLPPPCNAFILREVLPSLSNANETIYELGIISKYDNYTSRYKAMWRFCRTSAA